MTALTYVKFVSINYSIHQMWRQQILFAPSNEDKLLCDCSLTMWQVNFLLHSVCMCVCVSVCLCCGRGGWACSLKPKSKKKKKKSTEEMGWGVSPDPSPSNINKALTRLFSGRDNPKTRLHWFQLGCLWIPSLSNDLISCLTLIAWE